jgi:tRNA A-37 threonylcarbamoyl transferase component Bud32
MTQLPDFVLVQAGASRTLVRRGFEPELPGWLASDGAGGSAAQPGPTSGVDGTPAGKVSLDGGRGAVRTVELAAGGRAFVRRYRHGGLLRALLRDVYWQWPPRPWRELYATEAARRAGVTAPEVLAAAALPAFSRARRPGWLYRGVLVTRELDDRRSLRTALLAATSRGERQAWIEGAVAAIERLHDHGIRHPDLNATNLLVGNLPDAPVAIIDFDRAVARPASVGRLGRALAWRRLARSIGKLGLPGLDPRGVRSVIAAVLEHRRHAAEARALAWDAHEVVELALHGRRGASEHARAPSGGPHEPASGEEGRRVLKVGPRSTVVWLDHAGPGREAVVVKVLRARNLWQRIESWLVGPPATAQEHGARLLLGAGIDTGIPLAAVEHLDEHSGERSSVYISRAVVDAEPLHAVVKRLAPGARRGLAADLGRFVAGLHAHGIYVPDLKDENVLVAEERDQGGWRFFLVDLDRVRRPWNGLSARRRIANLVQLERTLGRTCDARDRLKLVAAYRRALPEPRPRLSTLVRRVDAARRRKDRSVARRRRQAGFTPQRLPVSAIVVCGNEAHRIRACLESVRWCDELVVVDSLSSDGTYEICREYATKLIRRPWPGHVEQKQYALDQTSHPWVLNIDADECVSPRLRDEIEEVLAHDGAGADGFYIPRLVNYLGRWWRLGGWYPDPRLRLFRRDRVVWGGINPHEKAILHGRAGRLHNPILHFTYDDVSDHVRTINRFTTTAAAERRLLGRHSSWPELVLRPLVRFLRFYVWRGGFLTGLPGLYVALSAALYVHLKYAKLDEASPQAGEEAA